MSNRPLNCVETRGRWIPASKGVSRRWLVMLAASLALVAIGVTVIAFIAHSQREPFEPQVVGAPAIAVDQTFFDYGVVPLNEEIETVMRVRNVGDEPLYILGAPHVEVREGCCPPQAHVSAKTLYPGDFATVHIAFSMHEGMGGPHDFRLHVRSTDPAQPESEITILSDWVG